MELDRSTQDMARRHHYRKQTKPSSHRGSAEILSSSQNTSTPSPPRTSSSPEGKSITSSQQSVIGRMDMMSTAESRTSLQTSGSNLTPPKGRASKQMASPSSPTKSWDMQRRIGQTREMSAKTGSYGYIDSSRQPSRNGSSLRLPAAEGSMAASLPVGGGRDSSLQQYLSKRQKEISSYMDSIRSQIPIPEEFTVHGK